MAEKHRLSDALKLKASSKWAFFHRIATNQDGPVFKTLSMANKGDAATISELTKLVAAEQKKGNYDHVVTLIRTIRRCFMDDEKAFRAMVNGGLDKAIFASISDLRKNATRGISGQAPVLRLLLANISDMFEWEFFGQDSYRHFIEEMLAVLSGCNDCDDSLFAEAASVIMSMCTTSISRVFDCFLQAEACASMLEKVLRDLPRAKSFYYEALLLELVYRLHRYSKKHCDEKMSRLITRLIDAFPVQIARILPRIPPKAFRDETRGILNGFNAQVGVIKSFQLKGLKLSGSKLTKIPLKPTGWIDLGGTILEIETTVLIFGEEMIRTIKLPFNKIDSVASSKSKPLVFVGVTDSVHLSDIMDGDPAIADSSNLRMCLTFEDKACLEVIKVLNQRKDTRILQEEITVVSSVMQSELSGSGPDVERPSTDIEAMEPKRSVPRRLNAGKPNQKLKSTEKKIPKQPRPSAETDVDAESLKPATKARANAVAPKTSDILDRNGHSSNAADESNGHEQSWDKMDEEHKENISPTASDVIRARKQGKCARQLLSKFPHNQEAAAVVPNEDEVPDENDQRTVTENQAATDTQEFRLRQNQQLHQLQSLVSDIVQANDQFRQFNIASHCRDLVGESDRQLKRKREHRDGADVFESTNAAIRQGATRRAEDLSRRQVLQLEVNEAVSATAAAKAEILTRAEELLAAIQKNVDSEAGQIRDRMQKKLRTQANQCMTKTKEKLLAIEKAFNTEDLRAMQQMLQRI